MKKIINAATLNTNGLLFIILFTGSANSSEHEPRGRKKNTDRLFVKNK
jgi:hypothetical protein